MHDDIGELLEPRLRESEERYKAVIENASDMIQSVLPDGTFEFANRAWFRTLRFEPEDLANLNVWDVIHPESREHCEIAFSRTMHGESVDYVRAIFVTKDGEPVPVEGSATVRMVGDEVVATHGFFRDIRERLRADELERRNEELERERVARYLEKMAALGKLAAGLSHELNNPAAAAQRAASSLVTAIDLRDCSSRELTAANLTAHEWNFLESLITEKIERRGDGRIFSPLESSQHEMEVEDWLEDHGVDEGWKLAPDLVAMGICSHELDATGKQISGDVLPSAVQWLASTASIGDLTRTIARSASRMAELVGAVKAYSYMDRAVEQVVDIHDGIENTLIIMAHRLRQMEVRRAYDRSLPHVRAFGSGLNQVWTNLIDNAVDATDGSGRIEIRTERDGDFAVVSIVDDGPGIPAEHITRVFEPFFTTKPQGSGTGLGLDTVWRIITEEHGGTIDVSSAPGLTTFRVSIPLLSNEE